MTLASQLSTVRKLPFDTSNIVHSRASIDGRLRSLCRLHVRNTKITKNLFLLLSYAFLSKKHRLVSVCWVNIMPGKVSVASLMTWPTTAIGVYTRKPARTGRRYRTKLNQTGTSSHAFWHVQCLVVDV